MVVRILGYALLAALALFKLAAAQAAELSASVDRKELVLQEHVVLTLSLINSDTRLRAQGISPNVDLSELTKDFDIGTPHVENRYNIYRSQGRSTSELTVDLFPRHAGHLTIPVFSVDGLHTSPITIVARPLPAGSLPEIFSKGGVSAQSVWQRQQVVAWLDVYHRIKLKTASVGEYIETEPMAIELMEHHDLPQSERKEKVGGIAYDVTRIAWAIFPKQSGTMTINLPDVWAVTGDGRKLRLPHQQQRVEVKTLPDNVTADIPVGTPLLTQTPPRPAPSVNKVSTWTVTVRGPFSRFALPDTLPLAAMPAHIKVSSDHAQRKTETVTGGLTSVVEYTLSALPQSGGTFKLPPIRIPYFDSKRGAMAVAEAEAVTLTVPAAAVAPTPHADKTTAVHTTVRGGATTGNDKLLWWQLTALLFAMMWIATMIRLWTRPRTTSPETVQTAPPVREPPPPAIHHPLQAQLLAAFGSRTLEQGLDEWEHRHGGDAQLRDTVRAVQRLCYGQERNPDTGALARRVEQAATKIRGRASQHDDVADDPWRPEAFTASPAHK
ncbi:MAG: BatD family protein [Gammaproteobacteria bacterium]